MNNYYAHLTHEGVTTELKVGGDGILHCGSKNLIGVLETNAIEVYCYNNQLTELNCPNATEVYCSDNPLKAIVKECGKNNRQIWSQKVEDTIYTYIGCGQFTLEQAIEAINEKYKGEEAEEYIEKVKLSQSMAE